MSGPHSEPKPSPAHISSYAFSTYGGDARLYNGVHDLERALLQAVKVIKLWHGMNAPPGTGGSRAMMQEAWSIYWRDAPEMAPIRDALARVNLDEVENL